MDFSFAPQGLYSLPLKAVGFRSEPPSEIKSISQRNPYAITGKRIRTPCQNISKPYKIIWVVIKIMVPFGVPNIIRHLLFRVPKKGP